MGDAHAHFGGGGFGNAPQAAGTDGFGLGDFLPHAGHPCVHSHACDPLAEPDVLAQFDHVEGFFALQIHHHFRGGYRVVSDPGTPKVLI